MMKHVDTTLELLLEQASNGSYEAAREFYRRLWTSEIFVPVVSKAKGVPKAKEVPKAKGVPKTEGQSGGDNDDPDQFCVVDVEGQPTLPVFTKAEFVKQWSNQRVGAVPKLFKTLVWLVRSETWLHINPGCEIGKAISPWEIEQFKDHGLDSLDEIVAESMPSTKIDEVEVEAAENLYVDYKRQLRAVLEVYTEVSEAFLVSIKEVEAKGVTILVGLRRKKIEPDRLTLLCGEICDSAKDTISSDNSVTVVDDIENKTNPYSSLFEEILPFYFATVLDCNDQNVDN